MSNSQGFIQRTITAVKDALGFDQYPQSKVLHNRQYLNDIASGNWSSLTHVTTTVRSYPVVGFPVNFKWNHNVKFNTKSTRCPFLEEIRAGRPLKSVVTKDKCQLNWSGYKYCPRVNRKELLNEIRGFSVTGLKVVHDKEYLNDISRGKWKRLNHVPTEAEKGKLLKEIEGFSKSGLKRVNVEPGLIEKAKEFVEDKVEQVKEVLGMEIHPQGKVEHDRAFLNDIAKGNWESLNHVSKVCEKNMPVAGVKIRKSENRKVLLKEVKEGCDLKHVETIDKCEVKVGSGYKMKTGVDRKQLMNEIQEGTNLAHVGSS